MLLPKDYIALAGFPRISQFLESTDHFCRYLSSVWNRVQLVGIRLDFCLCLTKYTDRMETEEQLNFDMWLPRQAHSALGKTQVRTLRYSTALSKALVLPSHGKKMKHEIGL